MQLTKIETMLARLAMQDQENDDNFLSVVGQSLDAAAIFLEGQLDTTFEQDAHSDTFYIDPDIYQAFGGLYRLKLSNGFVAEASLSLSKIDSLFDTSLVSVQLTAQEYLVSPKLLAKGFIDIREELQGTYVTVGYTSGFSDISEVPTWLSEASLAHAISVMSWQQVGDEKPALSKILQEVQKYREAVLNRHLRRSSHAIPAVRSV